MASSTQNALFTAWDSSIMKRDSTYLQSIINYCASRFRAAAMRIANHTDMTMEQSQIQVGLFGRELAVCLTYIGMAAGIGEPLNIPLIIRALACDYYQHGREQLRIIWDDQFLLSLDAGTADDDPTTIVGSYLYEWWKEEPDKEMTILSEEVIDECMEYHHFHGTSNGVIYGERQKTKYTWARDMLSCDPIPCKRCRLYRYVAMGVADELHDLRHHVHGLEVCFEGRSHLTARRAAGLFELYNASCLKELTTTDAPNTPGSSSEGITATTTTGMPAAASTTLPLGNKGKGKEIMEHPVSAQIRENAAHELKRLKHLPELKWTYGPNLTEEDVLEMVQRSIGVGEEVNFGYVDLPLGSEGDSEASERSQLLRCRSPIFSQLSPDICDPPELNIAHYPWHFRWPPLCVEFINCPSDVHCPSWVSSMRNYMEMPPPARAAASDDNSTGRSNTAGSGPVQGFSDLSNEDGDTTVDVAVDGDCVVSGPVELCSDFSDEDRDAVVADTVARRAETPSPVQAFSDLSDDDGDAAVATAVEGNAIGSGRAYPFSDSSDDDADATVVEAVERNAATSRPVQAFSDLSDDDGEAGVPEAVGGNAVSYGRVHPFADSSDDDADATVVEAVETHAATFRPVQAFSDLSDDDVEAAVPEAVEGSAVGSGTVHPFSDSSDDDADATLIEAVERHATASRPFQAFSDLRDDDGEAAVPEALEGNAVGSARVHAFSDSSDDDADATLIEAVDRNATAPRPVQTCSELSDDDREAGVPETLEGNAVGSGRVHPFSDSSDDDADATVVEAMERHAATSRPVQAFSDLSDDDGETAVPSSLSDDDADATVAVERYAARPARIQPFSNSSDEGGNSLPHR